MYIKIEAKIKFRDFGIDLGHTDKKFQTEIPTVNPIEGFIAEEALQLLDGGKQQFTKEIVFNGIDCILSISNDPFPAGEAQLIP